MNACVQRFLVDIPDTYRAVILLHDSQGLTGPEIAALLGVSLPTVKIRSASRPPPTQGSIGGRLQLLVRQPRRPRVRA